MEKTIITIGIENKENDEMLEFINSIFNLSNDKGMINITFYDESKMKYLYNLLSNNLTIRDIKKLDKNLLFDFKTSKVKSNGKINNIFNNNTIIYSLIGVKLYYEKIKEHAKNIEQIIGITGGNHLYLLSDETNEKDVNYLSARYNIPNMNRSMEDEDYYTTFPIMRDIKYDVTNKGLAGFIEDLNNENTNSSIQYVYKR